MSTGSSPRFSAGPFDGGLPDAPTLVAQVGSAASGGDVVVTGTGDLPGDTITLYDGSTVVGSGSVASDGTFTITTTAFTDGVYGLVATDTSDGVQSGASNILNVTVNPDAPANLIQANTAVNGGPIELIGTGETAGDVITLYNGATVVGAGTLSADNTFDIVTTATFADGVYTLTATETDAGGLISAAASVAVQVDPSAPTHVAQAGAAVNGGTVEVTGVGETVGDTVSLYDAGVLVGSGVVQAGGGFDITTTGGFADGAYTFGAVETDSAGLASAATAVSVQVAPLAPVLGFVVGSPSAGHRVTIVGTGELGDTVDFYADGQPTVVATGQVRSGDVYLVTTINPLSEGYHTVTATETDAAGVTSQLGNTLSFAVAPAAPTVAAVTTRVLTGNPVPLSGKGEAGDTVTLYADGGVTPVATAVVGSAGTYSVTTTATFTDGLHTFSATETDSLGLVSPISNLRTVSISPDAPVVTGLSAPAVNGGFLQIAGTGQVGDGVSVYAYGTKTVVATGTVGADGTFTVTTTNSYADGLYSFYATQTDIAGVTSALGASKTVSVAPSAPVLTGLATPATAGAALQVNGVGEAGETVTLFVNGAVAGTTVAGAGGAFTITTTKTYNDGVFTLTAKETDKAKLISAAGTPLTVTIAPPAPTLTSVVGQPVNGADVIVKGTGEAGLTVKLYSNGGTTVVGSGKVSTAGTFQIATSAFADGVYTLTAVEVDATGAASAPSAGLPVSVLPNMATVAGAVGVAVDNAPLTLIGNAEAGDTVNLFVDGGSASVGTAVANSNGVYSIKTTGDFSAGVHQFTAEQTDAAGLTSLLGPAHAVTVLPSAPVLGTVVTTAVNGNPISLNGTGDAGDTVTLFLHGQTTVVGTAVVAANGTFQITTTNTYADGLVQLNATETNGAHLTSPQSVTHIVTVLPSAPVLSGVQGQPVAGQDIVVTGSGEAGETITLAASGHVGVVGTGVAGSDGSFAITTSQTFAAGTYSVTAHETDSAGLVSGVSNTLTVTVPSAGAVTAFSHALAAGLGGSASAALAPSHETSFASATLLAARLS
jgi:hypothetical protein